MLNTYCFPDDNHLHHYTYIDIHDTNDAVHLTPGGDLSKQTNPSLNEDTNDPVTDQSSVSVDNKNYAHQLEDEPGSLDLSAAPGPSKDGVYSNTYFLVEGSDETCDEHAGNR